MLDKIFVHSVRQEFFRKEKSYLICKLCDKGLQLPTSENLIGHVALRHHYSFIQSTQRIREIFYPRGV